MGHCNNEYLNHIEVAVELGSVYRDWKTLEVHVKKKKILHCCKWTMKGDSGESSEEKRAGEKASIRLESK